MKEHIKKAANLVRTYLSLNEINPDQLGKDVDNIMSKQKVVEEHKEDDHKTNDYKIEQEFTHYQEGKRTKTKAETFAGLND